MKIIKCVFLVAIVLSDVKLHLSSTYMAGLSSAVGRVPDWVRYPVWPHTFVSPSADSKMAAVSYWRRYAQEVLDNRLGGLSLPKKSVVKLTERLGMALMFTVDVKQHNNNNINLYEILEVRVI